MGTRLPDDPRFDKYYQKHCKHLKPKDLHLGEGIHLYDKPGLSNKRFRLWFATLSQSNLIR